MTFPTRRVRYSNRVRKNFIGAPLFGHSKTIVPLGSVSSRNAASFQGPSTDSASSKTNRWSTLPANKKMLLNPGFSYERICTGSVSTRRFLLKIIPSIPTAITCSPSVAVPYNDRDVIAFCARHKSPSLLVTRIPFPAVTYQVPCAYVTSFSHSVVPLSLVCQSTPLLLVRINPSSPTAPTETNPPGHAVAPDRNALTPDIRAIHTVPIVAPELVNIVPRPPVTISISGVAATP